ncbi:MAG: SIMPL domain-containing protein [Candidatus Vogelbacteria bacterium]|nr:SIMPL domain-containing protein [Candidatus Vogelbacteria bacterium]
MNELFSHRWTPRLFAALVGACAFFVATLFLSELKSLRYVGDDVYPQRTITVSGTGEIAAIPDIAEFTYSVIEEANSLELAQATASEKSNAAIKFLKLSGVSEKDIKTIGYDINPRYEFHSRQDACVVSLCPPEDRERVLVGYEINQMVRVKVRDIAVAGELLAGVGTLGVSGISGVTFSVDKDEALKSSAREEAIQMARGEGKRIARALGTRIGRIVSFSEYGGAPIYPLYREAKSFDGSPGDPLAGPPPVVSAGENIYSSQVTIVYELR